MFTIPIFILACLCFVNLALLVYVFYYSYATKHYDNLVSESKKLENDIKFSKADLAGILHLVDYYKNRLNELTLEYFSKKNSNEENLKK